MAGCQFLDESPFQPRPSRTTAFNKLPIELNQFIAHHLESDRDIASFRAVCRQTNAAIDGDHFSFWRTRFRETFAYDENLSNARLRKVYQKRSSFLRVGVIVRFYHGHSKNERRLLRVLRDLIVQSFTGEHGVDKYGRPQCLNQVHLIKFIQNSMSFLSVKRLRSKEPEELTPGLAAIQIMCSHFLFGLESKHDLYAAEVSQKAVYQSSEVAPIYIGYNKSLVNMEWVLHCISFFRNHFMDPELGEMCSAIEALSYKQKPSAWQEPLQSGCYKLSENWKGTYAFLDINELVAIRESDGDQVFMDRNIDQGLIQSLELKFLPPADDPSWPDLFDKHLHSLREIRGAKTRAQHRTKVADGDPRSIQLKGEGEDNDDHFHARGWLNPLPAQPEGFEIPGWQRITFMKHFYDAHGNIEQDHLWAYEGVVLPGGRLIVGRWWWASDEPETVENSGPFILWAVDPDEDDVIDLTGDDNEKK